MSSRAIHSLPTLFLFLTYIIVLCAVPAIGSERGVCLRVGPSICARLMYIDTVQQAAFEYYSPMFTVIIRKWPCWTRAQSSTSLCKRKLHPVGEKNKNNAVSTSKSCAIFLQRGTHNISPIAQTQWQNRTQVVVSTQSSPSPQHRCHHLC